MKLFLVLIITLALTTLSQGFAYKIHRMHKFRAGSTQKNDTKVLEAKNEKSLAESFKEWFLKVHEKEYEEFKARPEIHQKHAHMYITSINYE